jgi:hypothetical protein
MITSGLNTSFKEEILLGEHDLDTDVLKIALYTSAATLDASTTVLLLLMKYREQGIQQEEQFF